MKQSLAPLVLVAALILFPTVSFSEISPEKQHDFLPKVHNVIFLFDVSDSMTAGYPKNFDYQKLFVAGRAFKLFNLMMPSVPRWQYDVNTALITFGDALCPQIVVPLSPWMRAKYEPYYCGLRKDTFFPFRTAALQDALQVAGSLISSACGRTAVVIFSDGGDCGDSAQRTAVALKNTYGSKVTVYAVSFGTSEVGWRNLYEVCKLTGGYCRPWEEVRDLKDMKRFAWDITVREIMFPYPEIFFKEKSAELIPSEAMKLESVANFLHAIPQYMLQIDGHTTFFGKPEDNEKLGMERARNVKETLVKMFNVVPDRIRVRSWGGELPRYDNQNPDMRVRNDEANLYLMLPLRNFPYNEKKLHTFGVSAVGNIYNTQERDSDEEWAWPDKSAPGAVVPTGNLR
ncbi:MAG: OmpA family protein [Desulfomonile tiedjei]|nr:OmpA family protein [Desulfomonile tiedjei]